MNVTACILKCNSKRFCDNVLETITSDYGVGVVCREPKSSYHAGLSEFFKKIQVLLPRFVFFFLSLLFLFLLLSFSVETNEYKERRGVIRTCHWNNGIRTPSYIVCQYLV